MAPETDNFVQCTSFNRYTKDFTSNPKISEGNILTF